MNGGMTQVAAEDGAYFDAYLTGAEGDGAPGIVLVQEIFGLTSAIIKAADMFAAQGFAVIAPDMHWRNRRNFVADYVDEADRAEAFRLHDAHDYALGLTDIMAAARTLKALPRCNGRIGVTGYCMGGNYAFLAAARMEIDAAAGYYGTEIHTYLDEGPAVARPLLLHIGAHDHTCTDADRDRVCAALAENPNIEIHTYDAGHAFANTERPDVYRPQLADQANARSFAHFARPR